MFGRMRIYTVHVKPEVAGTHIRPLFVKEGFNFVAFIFSFLWALYNRLWPVVLCIMAFDFLLVVLSQSQMLSRAAIALTQLAMHVFVGFQANDWRRAKLRRKGYVLSDIAAADSYLRAQQRYFERYVAAAQHG